ncbi:LamG-like jellyroll fold domain-containing protein [Chryseolinea soli]|nr:LamG-like jellyroll fold domain-containing protein [Chryseolinea soli]
MLSRSLRASGKAFGCLLTVILSLSTFLSAYSQTSGGTTAVTNPCQGEPVTYNTGIDTQNCFIQALDKPNEATSISINGANVTITWSAPGSYSFRPIVRCGSTVTPGSYINVTVKASPAAVITPTGAAEICSNGTLFLLATPSSGYTYQWYKDVTTPVGSNSPNYATSNSPGTHNYTVKLTGSNSCYTISSPKTVTQNAAPTSAVLSAYQGFQKICSGQSAYVSSNISGGTPPYSFTLSNGTVVNNYFSPQPIMVNPNTTTTYTFASGVTDAKGCTVSGTGSGIVYVQQTLTASFENNPSTSSCVGQTQTFTTQGGMVSYSWSIPPGATVGGGGSLDNSMTVTWTTPGTKTIRVSYIDGDEFGCQSTEASLTVTVGQGFVPTISTTATDVCVGTTNNVYTTESGQGNYQWSVSAGGTITAGAGTSSITVTWNTPGAQTVTASYGASTSCTVPATKQVTVSAPPAPVTDVLGLKVNFVGEPSHLQAVGAADATSFVWDDGNSGVNFTNQGTGIPGRDVWAEGSSDNCKTLTVQPMNHGCAGTTYNFPFRVLPKSSTPDVLPPLKQDALSCTSANGACVDCEKFLFLPKHSNHYVGCIDDYGLVTLKLKADFGELYNLGERPFTVSFKATVTAYYDLPGINQTFEVNFKLTTGAPEQLYLKELAMNPQLLKFIGIKVSGFSSTDAVASSFVELVSSFEENEDAISAATATVLPTPAAIDNTKWEQTFTWTSCPDVTNYQFQLLRIYGQDEAAEIADWNKAWDKALNIYTESDETSVTVSMAEGGNDSKYYWRVRAIGNLEDGLANPENLKAIWSSETSGVQGFNYTHPEDNKNWIYSRTFTEGNHVSEQLTYANGLQQVNQQQTRLQDVNQVVASQTLQDYAGRNAVSSLPIPVAGRTKLGYISNLLSNGASSYSTGDFDFNDLTTDKVSNPSTAVDLGGYYSGTDNGQNAGVANAEGYPYTRTIFTNDGTGRVKEQSGVGQKHSLAGGKTAKTVYSNPAAGELIQLFGKEAPNVNSVQKITTYDANGTGSVAYKTKDGKVIATALVVTTDITTTHLTALASRATAAKTIVDEVKLNTRENAYTAVSRKPLVFSANTSVTVDYEITPAQLLELCPPSVNSTGLVSYYPFDGDATDAGTKGYNGTSTGASVVPDAFGGQALALDGGTGYIDMGDNADFDFGADDFTVSYWVRKNVNTPGNLENTPGVNKWANTASKGTNEWALNLSTGPNSNRAIFQIESGQTMYNVASINNLTLGAWAHLVGVRRAGKIYLFVNGVLQGSTTVNSVPVNNVGRPLWVGKIGAGLNTAGYFDELAIYRRGLSDDEVKQLYQRSGPLCKTCDYKVEFFLHKDGDPLYVNAGLPPAQLIQAGECADQTSLKWDPPVFTLADLEAGVLYQLEKRITINNLDPNTTNPSKTYLQEHEDQLRTYYEGQAYATGSVLKTVQDMLAPPSPSDPNWKPNLQALKIYLDGKVTDKTITFDPDNQQYVIPVSTGTNGCRDYVFIQAITLCATNMGDACAFGTGYENDYERYFKDEILKRDPQFVLTTTQGGVVYLNYAYFTNRLDNTKLYFAQGQLNTMIANLIADNSGRVTCNTAWDVFQSETEMFLAKGAIDYTKESPDNLEILGPNMLPTNTDNNLYDNFVKALDGRIKEAMNTGQTVNENDPVPDVCNGDGSNGYFVKKSDWYGWIQGASVQPDLLHAYRLVFMDDRVNGLADALRYCAGVSNTTPVTASMLMGLTFCKKYQLSQLTQFGDQGVNDEQTKAAALTKAIDLMRKQCGKACEARSEEFRQALINDIMNKNNAAKIEHYSTRKDMWGNRWIGLYDGTANTTGFDYSECEIDAMVEALIENCKGYCNTPLTPWLDAATGVTVYGTQGERDKLKKAMLYDFEVSISSPGQSCQAGWDEIKPSMSSETVNCLIPAAAADAYLESFIDKAGNVYVMGRYRLWVDLNDGTRLSNADQTIPDFFLAKFSQEGVLQWYRKFKYEEIRSTLTGSLPVYTATENSGSSDPAFTIVNPISSLQSDYDLVLDGKKITGINLGEAVYHLFRFDANGNLLWDEVAANVNVKNLFYPEVKNIEYDNSFLHLRYPANSTDLGFSVLKRSGSNGNIIGTGSTLTTTYSQTGGIPTFRFENLSRDLNGNLFQAGEVSPKAINFIFDGVSRFQTSASLYSLVLSVYNSNGIYQASNVLTFSIGGGVSGLPKIDVQFIHYASQNKVIIKNGTGASSLTILGNSISGGQILTADIDNSGQLSNVQKVLAADAYYYIRSIDLSHDAKVHVTSSTTSTVTVVNSADGNSPATYELNDFYDLYRASETVFYAIAGKSGCIYNLEKFSTSGACSKDLCFHFTSAPGSVTIPDGLEDVVNKPQKQTCEAATANTITASINQQVEQAINLRIESFREVYKTCAEPSRINDKMVLSYNTGLHHFTLYYYDRAGNLMRTVPPKGVVLLPVNTTAAIASSSNLYPAHTLVTEYQYNSLGQLVRQHTPDANPAATVRPVSTSTESVFNASDYFATSIYNDKGKIRFSRNAKQKQASENKYAYTKYDELGRIIEVGEVDNYNEAMLYSMRNQNSSFPSTGRFVTKTFYTQEYDPATFATGHALPTGYEQNNLRNRVSYTLTDEDGDLTMDDDQVITIYSYDPHGNINWILQQIPGMQISDPNHLATGIGIRYQYDLISGKVTQVSYNPGQADAFYHKYEYDENNRITTVFTSRDSYLWEKEAEYSYYLHGQMKRTVIGEDQVQGMDYTHTIHGWLKALNNPQLDKTSDPMKDGDTGSLTARDAFGMALTYYSGDYRHSGSTLDASSPDVLSANGLDLYNGNIAAWASRNYYSGSINSPYANASVNYKDNVTGYQFQYDELNRLLQSNFNYLSGTWTSAGTAYKSTNAYDANGNITSVVTYDGSALVDNVPTTAPMVYYAKTNQLSHVPDLVTTPGFGQDVEPQAAGNYLYDQVGNLTRDQKQGNSIKWSPYGKVLRVNNDGGTYTQFHYDALGNRVSKRRTNTAGLSTTTYYVRDAAGNIMGVYERTEGGTTTELTLLELPIYGSNRLGQYNKPITVPTQPIEGLQSGEVRIDADANKNTYEGISYLINSTVTLTLGPGFTNVGSDGNATPLTVRIGESGGVPLPGTGMYTRELSSRLYELKDHLGNIRAVITDTKLSVVSSGTPVAFEPKVTNVSNYYPFGMDQPGRTWSADLKYRYAFNGKEKDGNGEWGSANYDYGFRIYNPSIGRFLNIDPLADDYPMLTPYQFASNTPIQAIDLDGLEGQYYVIDLNSKEPKLKFNKTVDYWLIPNSIETDYVTVEAPGPNGSYISYTFTAAAGDCPGCGTGNYIEDFKKFKEDPIQAIASGEYRTDQEILGNMVKEAALALLFKRAIKLPKTSTTNTLGITRKLTAKQNGKVFAFTIKDGKIKFADKNNGKGLYDFVITEKGEFKIGRGHYTLSGEAASVKGAGQIHIDSDGKIDYIDDYSGHYQPNKQELIQQAEALKAAGLTAEKLDVVTTHSP